MLGICKRGYYKGELFEVQPGRDVVWFYYGSGSIYGFNLDDFDFNENNIIEHIINKNRLGTSYTPTEILIKLIKQIPNDKENLWQDILFEIDHTYYPESIKKELKTLVLKHQIKKEIQ